MMFTGEQHTWIKQFPPHCEVSSEMLERICALFTDNVQFIHAETKWIATTAFRLFFLQYLASFQEQI
jgi:hypothetical protein